MLYYMNSNTALVMFAMVAMLGLATATVVIPTLPSVFGLPTPGPGNKQRACTTPGAAHAPQCVT